MHFLHTAHTIYFCDYFYIRITRAEAEEIANSMINVLKNWQTVARRYGLPQAEINRMAPAFKV